VQPKSFFPQNSCKSKDQKGFATHLEGSHGTQVCRSTPDEKRWIRETFCKVNWKGEKFMNA
jgi:hypothetical protein